MRIWVNRKIGSVIISEFSSTFNNFAYILTSFKRKLEKEIFLFLNLTNYLWVRKMTIFPYHYFNLWLVIYSFSITTLSIFGLIVFIFLPITNKQMRILIIISFNFKSELKILTFWNWDYFYPIISWVLLSSLVFNWLTESKLYLKLMQLIVFSTEPTVKSTVCFLYFVKLHEFLFCLIFSSSEELNILNTTVNVNNSFE